MIDKLLHLSNTHLNNIDHYPVASSLISAPLRGVVGITGTVASLAQIVFHEIAATFHSYKGDQTKSLTHIQSRDNAFTTLKASIDAISRAFIAAIPIFGNIVLSKNDGQIAQLKAEKEKQTVRHNRTKEELRLSNESIAGLISAQNTAYVTQRQTLNDLQKANSKIDTLTQEKQQVVDQLNIETSKLRDAEGTIQALNVKLVKVAQEMNNLALLLENDPIHEDTDSIVSEDLLNDSLASADQAAETVSSQESIPEKKEISKEISPVDKKRNEIQAKKRAEKKRIYSRLKAAKAQSRQADKFVAPILKKLRK